MINLGDDYGNIKPLQEGEIERLPAGGYVCIVLFAQVKNTKNGKPMLVLSLDIAEGKYAKFYANVDNYSPRIFRTIHDKDGKVSPFFKGLLDNFEQSNSDLKIEFPYFDETKLKNKKIGVIFGEEEYLSNGEVKTSIKPVRTTTVENIRNGKFKVPEPKKLNPADKPTTGKIDEDFAGEPVDDIPLPF